MDGGQQCRCEHAEHQESRPAHQRATSRRDGHLGRRRPRAAGGPHRRGRPGHVRPGPRRAPLYQPTLHAPRSVRGVPVRDVGQQGHPGAHDYRRTPLQQRHRPGSEVGHKYEGQQHCRRHRLPGPLTQE